MATLVAEFEKKVEALEAKGESFAALRELLQFARLNNVSAGQVVVLHALVLHLHSPGLASVHRFPATMLYCVMEFHC